MTVKADDFMIRGTRCRRELGPDGMDIVTPIDGPQWRIYFLPGKPFDIEQVGKAIDAMPAAEKASEIFEKAWGRS